MDKLKIYNLFKNNKRLNKGLFLAFEGLDGSSKGTQTKLLTEYLKQEGYKVHVVRFPQYEKLIGQTISSYLRGEFGDINSVPYELICIAYAADRASIRDEIQNYLANGYVVIADRYTYSNLFTAAKMEKEKRLPFIKWIEQMEFNELKVVKPDYNFLLYVDPEISLQRIAERGKRDYQNGKDDIHENNAQLLYDTAETYLDFAQQNDNWIVINQMRDSKQMSIEEVFAKIKKHVDTILSERELI